MILLINKKEKFAFYKEDEQKEENMKILEIIGFDKETVKEINIKETLAIFILLLTMTIISDDIISMLTVFFMIVSAIALLYLSKKR